jgi:hypothetical protein
VIRENPASRGTETSAEVLVVEKKKRRRSVELKSLLWVANINPASAGTYLTKPEVRAL